MYSCILSFILGRCFPEHSPIVHMKFGIIQTSDHKTDTCIISAPARLKKTYTENEMRHKVKFSLPYVLYIDACTAGIGEVRK